MYTVKQAAAALLERPIDGRKLRSERTRHAIVSALLSLADEGELAPTAQQVADAAGVALRSIRQHFESRESLFLAAAAEHARRAKTEEPVTVSADLPIAERIVAFAKARTKDLESTAPLRRAASLEEERSDVIAKTIAAARTHRRKEVARVFEREIKRARDAEAFTDALELVCGARGYDSLIRDFSCTPVQARTRIERMLTVLLVK